MSNEIKSKGHICIVDKWLHSLSCYSPLPTKNYTWKKSIWGLHQTTYNPDPKCISDRKHKVIYTLAPFINKNKASVPWVYSYAGRLVELTVAPALHPKLVEEGAVGQEHLDPIVRPVCYNYPSVLNIILTFRDQVTLLWVTLILVPLKCLMSWIFQNIGSETLKRICTRERR